MLTDPLTMALRISDARMGCDMTLATAAKRLGVKIETLRDWESGRKSPRANKLQMLAGLYNVSLIWLIEGRSDLDPLQTSPSGLDMVDHKLQHVISLQSELAVAIADLSQEIGDLKEKNDNLDRMAEEALNGFEYRRAG